jgi:hypothetical protein
MSLYTIINTTSEEIAGAGGPYPPEKAKIVDLNQGQLLSLLSSGLGVLPPITGGIAKTAIVLLSALTPGLATPSQRELFRLKGGQQEWQDLLRLLRSVD